MPKLHALAVAAASLLAMTGCQDASSTQTDARAEESAPYLTLDEFATVIGKSGATVVEFCVPTGCVRCDEMRPSIDKLAIEGLASDQGEQPAVRRVNLRQYPALAWEFGVTVCPTYVVFAGGREVGRAEYPTSADLVSAMIPHQLATE